MECVELLSCERPYLSWRFKVLDSLWDRLKGLLGSDRDAAPVLLMSCSSVHTFGMRYPLDLAFVGRDGKVLLSCMDVAPGQLLSEPGAFCVLERPSASNPWPQEGECVYMKSITVGTLCRPVFMEG